MSGSFRTEHGAHRFAIVRSYIETGRKHDLNALDLLAQLFNGRPWIIPAAVRPEQLERRDKPAWRKE